MRDYGFGRGKWVFVDWMGIEPGYGTEWGGAISEGWCAPQGIELKVHPPDVHSSLVIVADRPWEKGRMGSYATFMSDGGVLRCWYRLRSGLAYAESDDGVTWKKPNLGLVEWEGSTRNNLVNSPLHRASVFKDPVAPASERYKAVDCHWTGTERWVVGAVSPDGLNWAPVPQPLMKHQHADTQSIGAYDQELGKYVLYTRQKDGRMGRRGINRCESDDFRHFPPSEPVLESNPLDRPDWDFYTNGYSRWPGATDAHLMRPSIYQHTSDRVNVHLATSRDGKIWHRPLGRTPWIDRLPSHGDLYRSIYACAGIIPTAKGEWSTYIGVNSKGHNEPKKLGESAESGLVRASLREDGFMSISSEGRGAFWTIAFEFNSDTIRVNVRTRYSGFLRCEIISSPLGDVGDTIMRGALKPLEGYALDDCQKIPGDHLDIPLTWNGSGDVSHLRGKTVRLRFDLYKADLYAIRF